MLQTTVPPSSRPWLLARRALLAAAVVGLVLFVALRRHAPAPAPKTAEPSAASPGQRAARSVDIAARPRAGVGGHVLDPDKKPVAGAKVCAFAQQLAGSGLVTSQTLPRCVTTDREGRWALDDLFPATPIGLSASAPKFAPVAYRTPSGEAEIRLGEGERRGGVDIVLRAGGVALRGSVNDATGGAVEGAVVVSEAGADRSVGASDAKGEFTLWVEPGRVQVSATASGYAPGWANGKAPDHFFKINLVPGSTLVGRAVIAGEGTPAPGVFIEGIQVEGGWTRSSTKTDEEGRFRVEGLTPGRYRVEATSEGREGYSRSSVTLGLGETSSEIVVELDPAYVVRGRVVDKASGEPCTGGEVTITDGKQNEFSRASIDPEGWARMASVIPGDYRVEVACKDHVTNDQFAHVVVKDRDLPPLTWQVEKGGTVRVEVVDDRGRPVPKATVSASAMAAGGSYGQTDRTEADGTYLVSGLKTATYRVDVQTSEGNRAGTEASVTLGQEQRVRIELQAAGVIEGLVEDASHRPIGNVQLFASGPGNAFAMSGEDGTFTLSGLPPGEYEVRANERPGAVRMHGEAPLPAVKVTLAPPEHAKTKITVAARNGVIEGRVTDGGGQPVTDAFIDFSARGEVPRWAGGAGIVTDTDGHFTIDGLADGEYAVRAQRKGGGEANAEHVKVGTRDLVLKLDGGSSLAGTLTSRGAPVERFTLGVRDTKTGFTREELFFHAGGQFELHDLPAGTYELSADASDGSTSSTIVLAPGEQKTGVTLTLTLRGSVDGVLVDLESGAPIAGATLVPQGSSSMALMSGNTPNPRSGPDGRFHLDGVLPGSWGLTVLPADTTAYATVTVPIVVPEGGGPANVGSLRVPRQRIVAGAPYGWLGLYVDQGGDGPLVVRSAGGPAGEAGIQTDDVIVSVDGYDVQGTNRYLYRPLTTVDAGRTVTLGLARGATVSVVAKGF